jgi:hypothetical protein
MNADDRFEVWKRRRAAAEVPADFADRVMAGVDRLHRQPGQRPGTQRLMVFFLSSRLSRVGLWTLGSLALAFRMLSVVGLFFPQ